MSLILIIGIEDESFKREKKALKDAGYQVISSEDAEFAFEEALKKRPQIIVLDFTSPKGLDGQAIFRKFKKDRFLKDTPIVAILPEGKVEILDAIQGVDDFLFESFDDYELVVRVKNILKKIIPVDSKNQIKVGDLIIDVAKYEVTLNGRKLDMTYKEYELLKFLASNKEKVFTRDQLLDKIWGYDYYGGTRTVDVHIRRLRSKIEDRKHTFIETVRNIGYKFIGKE